MNIIENQVIDILKTIVHPSIGKDIVSLGIVKNISIQADKISFELSFSSVNDPLKSSLKRACELTLKESLGEWVKTEITIVTAIKPIAAPAKGPKPLAGVKNIIAVSSGKGGVGKSTIAVNLAVAFAKTGAKTGLIDADIFGPSVPKMLGVESEKPEITKIDGKDVLLPVTKFNVKVLSIGFFIDSKDATVWRGPMASNALKQLIGDTNWGELDYLFIDLPPGTSDIHLTLVQTVPVTGAIIVSTPQDIALADAIKGIKMFQNENINVPILGLIENMAWFTPEELPDNKYYIFGKGGCSKLALEMNLPLLGQIPIVQGIREGGDNGVPVVTTKGQISEAFKNVAEKLRIEIIKRNTNLEPTKTVEITRRKFPGQKK